MFDSALHSSAPPPINVAIVGAGWRSEFFHRIAKACPQRFSIGAVLTKTSASAMRVKKNWGVPAVTTVKELLDRGPFEYVVLAVPRNVSVELMRAFLSAEVPVLAETPPAPTLPELVELFNSVGPSAPVQVAEQYHLQPHHAARIRVSRSGYLGDVQSTRISVAHGYHGVSLMRGILGVGSDEVTLTAREFVESVISTRGRNGWLEECSTTESTRIIANLDFGGRFGIFDFMGEQYFSPIRSRQISIWGSRGELQGDNVNYFMGPRRVVRSMIVREVAGQDGDLGGMYLRQLTMGEELLFENPFVPARLSDEEIAIAEVMRRMSAFVRSGAPFYGLADACQDCYIALLIDEAVQSGRQVKSTRQPWDDYVKFP